MNRCWASSCCSPEKAELAKVVLGPGPPDLGMTATAVAAGLSGRPETALVE